MGKRNISDSVKNRRNFLVYNLFIFYVNVSFTNTFLCVTIVKNNKKHKMLTIIVYELIQTFYDPLLLKHLK